jgi:hypothetical protein
VCNNHRSSLAEWQYILFTIIMFMMSRVTVYSFYHYHAHDNSPRLADFCWAVIPSLSASIKLSKETLSVDLIHSTWLYKGSCWRLHALEASAHRPCCKHRESHKRHHDGLQQYPHAVIPSSTPLRFHIVPQELRDWHRLYDWHDLKMLHSQMK